MDTTQSSNNPLLQQYCQIDHSILLNILWKHGRTHCRLRTIRCCNQHCRPRRQNALAQYALEAWKNPYLTSNNPLLQPKLLSQKAKFHSSVYFGSMEEPMADLRTIRCCSQHCHPRRQFHSSVQAYCRRMVEPIVDLEKSAFATALPPEKTIPQLSILQNHGRTHSGPRKIRFFNSTTTLEDNSIAQYSVEAWKNQQWTSNNPLLQQNNATREDNNSIVQHALDVEAWNNRQQILNNPLLQQLCHSRRQFHSSVY